MALGLEQEFFVIPREAYVKRIDIRSTGRALVGELPAKHQQFADHYYAKIPHEIENILKEVEDELIELGVPVKTRHNEVAINQF
jgi:glutamine synthetase